MMYKRYKKGTDNMSMMSCATIRSAISALCVGFMITCEAIAADANVEQLQILMQQLQDALDNCGSQQFKDDFMSALNGSAAMGDAFQPDAQYQYATSEQVFAQYQAWLQNADMQLKGQMIGLPPVMQLQLTIRGREGELSQWGGFLQQYYPMVYANRCAELQQCRQLLVMMMNGGMSMPMPAISPGGRFGGGSGGRVANRCIACRGGGTCRQCTGTGIVHASYGGSGSWTCTACKGSGRCTICNR